MFSSQVSLVEYQINNGRILISHFRELNVYPVRNHCEQDTQQYQLVFQHFIDGVVESAGTNIAVFLFETFLTLTCGGIMPGRRLTNPFLVLTVFVYLTLTYPLNSEPFEGYTLYNPHNSRTTYLLDMDLNRIHVWDNNGRGGYSVYLLENGNLLRPVQINNARLRGAAYSGLIQEIDWDGRIMWEFEYSSATYIAHHDIEPMPGGSILLIAWEVKTAAEALQAGRRRGTQIWPDHIIEVACVDDQGGEIIWEWHAWDHLIQDYDPQRDNYGVVEDHPELIDVNLGDVGGMGGGDWLHINGISYNPDRDEIVISSHYLDEIFVIDHSTTTEEAAGHEGGNRGMGGDILYRWGNPGNYRAQGEQYFDVVHCSWWIPDGLPGEGNILAFNNGEGARESGIIEIIPPYDEDGNYVIEPGQAFGPAEPVLVYSDGRNFYSNHLGGCQRLPNGNTLITESTEGHIFEISDEGEVLWEFDDRLQIARSLRYALDYPGLYVLNQLEPGEIVINEFLADNDTTHADQDGEFDGWVELYNNSDVDLSLWGFKLSNDPEHIDKWSFPDTMITAGGYLTVWTDADEDQEGLHCNFELSAEGGQILFLAPDLTELDNVDYDLQSPDRSTGRFPNGNGEFIEMTPTFESENVEDIPDGVKPETSDPEDLRLLHNYPNPFNSSTTFSFQLHSGDDATLTIYSINGKRMNSFNINASATGSHQINWNGTDERGVAMGSGVYLCILRTGSETITRKMVLTR